MRLYVGNVPYQATEADLERLFSEAGVMVDNVNLIRDRESGQSRGFAFVEIENDEDARRAIRACDGKDFLGRNLVVNEARPPRESGRSGGGAGGHGRSFGGGRGRGRPRW